MVTVTFEKKGDGTHLILRHAGFPNAAVAKPHERGWNSILDKFAGTVAGDRAAEGSD